MFYAALCDMTLYMYSDENSYKRSTHCSNVIHLHHSLATKAGDYIKKNHVFRLQTADMAQYLIQTRFTSELCTCLLSLYTVQYIVTVQDFSMNCFTRPAHKQVLMRFLAPTVLFR